MQIIKPNYYDQFHCVAGDCPDTCCANWAVVIDPESMAFYQAVPGELGKQLRDAMVEIDGEPCFGLENGLCRLLRPDGLCPIQKELGEEHLCSICSRYPRFSTEIGMRRELGLSLSCPEAARLILTAQQPLTLFADTTEEPMTELHELSPELILTMRALREHALSFAQDDRLPFSLRCIKILTLCAPVSRARRDHQLSQALADGLSHAQAITEVKPASNAGVSHFCQVLTKLLCSLEALHPAWRESLCCALAQPLGRKAWTSICPTLPNSWTQLLCYSIYKYFPRAVFDRAVWPAVVFCVLLPLLLRQLLAACGANEAQLLSHAWQLSREIEHSEKNMQLLWQGFNRRAFRSEALCALYAAIG